MESNMTHADKVYELLKDGNKHCQDEFHTFTWSPHKRRGDAERKYKITINFENCKHGIPGSRDYWIREFPKEAKKKYRPMSKEEEVIARQQGLFF